MADYRASVEFANFTCKFGNLNLLDFAEDVVIPAFLDGGRRTHGRTEFFFEDVQLGQFDSEDGPVLCIYGRFIKVTTLSRVQRYVEGEGIVRDPADLETAPTSCFVLLLNNHKLLYLKETPFAPGIAAFRSTAHYFIRKAHAAMLNATLERMIEESSDAVRSRGEEPRRVTQKERIEIIKQLRATFPDPTLEVVPMASDQSLETFLNQYGLLRSITIKFNRTNDEQSHYGFFEQIESNRDYFHSESTALVHQNTAGFKIPTAISFLTPIAEQGNQEISLDGIDKNGNRMRGNNFKFNLKASVQGLAHSMSEKASQLFATFESYRQSGILKASINPNADTKNKIARIIDNKLRNE